MTKHYVSRYPRSGQKAILCEGDLSGYEADLLESWTAEFPDIGLVDVWPCGTKTAIFGMSDALGRAVPVFVIEDRDHRTKELADKECKRNKKDRIARGVKIGCWRAWQRSEIENYLIEPAVLLPTFSEVFGTTEAVVSQRLQHLLVKTACDQSLQITLSEYRSAFPNGEKEVGGVSRQDGRPRWSECGLVVPEMGTVESLLRGVLSESGKRLAPDKHPKIEEFIKRFGQRHEQWSTMKVDAEEWRIDWAGKELLLWLRVQMAAEFGWPDKKDPTVRTLVKWESLSRDEFGEWDRRIERTLQERLVKRFLKLLRTGGALPPALVEEWHGIISELRCGVSPLVEPAE
jgi:hypothetical protein